VSQVLEGLNDCVTDCQVGLSQPNQGAMQRSLSNTFSDSKTQPPAMQSGRIADGGELKDGRSALVRGDELPILRRTHTNSKKVTHREKPPH
jgi:hypothetical protein